MNRALLRSIGRWLVGMMLIGQLAIAAHACPVWTQNAVLADLADAGSVAAQPVQAAGVECDEPMGAVDPQAANLCAEHCKTSDQGDRPSGIAVPAAWPVALYQSPPPPEPIDRRQASSLSALVAAAPPHAILHCVRRT